MVNVKKTSEFGKGLVYPIGLFLAHAEAFSHKHEIMREMRGELFFYAASDHLYELEIPSSFPGKIKEKVKEFQNYVFKRRLGMDIPISDIRIALDMAKNILYMIDKHIGSNPIKAEQS